jgi:hypothetical protein
LASLEEFDESTGGGGRMSVGEMGACAGDGCFEARGLEGFEQVVERMGFKCADGVLIVGCGEDHQRKMLAGNFFQELKAVHLGHLDIEEEKVGRIAFDSGERVVAAGAFSDDGEFRIIDGK